MTCVGRNRRAGYRTYALNASRDTGEGGKSLSAREGHTLSRREMLQGLKGHVDIVSYNDYGFEPPLKNLERIAEITGRPVMITEFSFKARDSGLPNTRGAGFPVDTQKDRADKFEHYVRKLAAMPAWVGYHWFEWCDEPKEGRFDGENSNYGLVRIDDTPWEELTQRFTRVNARLESWRLASGSAQ